MPDTVDYAAPRRDWSHAGPSAGWTGASAARFAAGLVAYAAVAFLLVTLNSLWGMQLLGYLHAPVVWLIGLGFVAGVVHLHRKWRWTGFTVGVGAGVVLSLVGGAVWYLVWMIGMSAF